MAEELTQWLGEIGLGAHAPAFAAQGVDLDLLADLSETDLKELGLSIGDRKRLVRAMAARTGKVTPAAAPPAAEPHPIEADRRQLTVMFIDLIDSSPLAQRFDPEEMRQILRAFHEACAAAIEAHEGHIAQYSGDGLLVYFGYPQAHEDDAVRGVLAGLAVIANLAAANIRLGAAHDVRLKVRIGVETGLVVAGEVGAGAALDRQAIVGETPIVASRLQALAPPDSVVVGPVTERLIQGSFRLQSLGRHALKGVAAPIDIWRVEGRTEAEGSFEVRAGRGLTPLVGRGAELEMLRQRWRQSCEGEMRCVLLVGEPGIGKSRMLRAFRDGLEGEEYQGIAYHGSPYHRESPFWPVLQRVRQGFGLDAVAGPEAAAARLETELRTFGVDLAEAMVVLSTLLGLPTAGRYPSIDTASPSFKQRCLNVFVAMVEAMAACGPLLIWVEDAHWLDPSTLELLRLMLDRLTASRLLLLITARPEFKPDWTSPNLVQLNLDRLSRRERVQMVERLTAGKPLPAPVLDQIVAKTDGVPLFVEELTKTVLQGDLLHDAGGRYELRGTVQDIAIPDTLQGSLLSRLDRLAPGVKEIAQVAATIGRDFDKGLLRRIATRDEDDIDFALAGLVEAEIIVPAAGRAGEGGAFRFRHALIQEIAYHSLLLARRRHFHGLIAGALEAHYPEIVDLQPEVLAQNFAASDAPERAIDYWRRAGEQAQARAAYEEAIAHAQSGIRLTEDFPFSDHERAERILPLLLIRGHAEFGLGERRAIATYQAAAELARTEKLTPHLVEAALWHQVSEGYLEGVVAGSATLLEAALAEVGDEETVDRSRLLGRLATTLHARGEAGRASDLARQAAVIARRLGDHPSLLDALSCELFEVGGRPLPRARFAERRRTLDEISRLLQGLGVSLSDCVPRGVTGARCLTACLEIGELARFDAALALYGEAVQSDPTLTVRWVAVGAQVMRAILIGDFALAERKAEELSQLVESAEATLAAGVYGMQMFTIRREQGRLGEVAPLLKRFVDENPEDKAWRPGLMLIASDLGFEAQARRTLAAMAEDGFALPPELEASRDLELHRRSGGQAGRRQSGRGDLFPHRAVCRAGCYGADVHALLRIGRAVRGPAGRPTRRLPPRRGLLRAGAGDERGHVREALAGACPPRLCPDAHPPGSPRRPGAGDAPDQRGAVHRARARHVSPHSAHRLSRRCAPCELRPKEVTMTRFLIERNFAQQVELDAEGAAGLKQINDEENVKWLLSFLSADKKKTYCLYEAESADAIRKAATRAGIPADVIIEVSDLRPEMFA